MGAPLFSTLRRLASVSIHDPTDAIDQPLFVEVEQQSQRKEMKHRGTENTESGLANGLLVERCSRRSPNVNRLWRRSSVSSVPLCFQLFEAWLPYPFTIRLTPSTSRFFALRCAGG